MLPGIMQWAGLLTIYADVIVVAVGLFVLFRLVLEGALEHLQAVYSTVKVVISPYLSNTSADSMHTH